MSETVDKCGKCEGPVERILSSPFNIKKNNNFGKKRPGNIVKQYIKDVKKEIKQEKHRILTQEYKPK